MFSILLFLRDWFLLPGKRFNDLYLWLVKHVDIIKSLCLWIKWNHITILMAMLRFHLHCCMEAFLIHIGSLGQVNGGFVPWKGRRVLALLVIRFIFLSHIWFSLNLLLHGFAAVASLLVRYLILGNLIVILLLFIFHLIVKDFNLNNIITNYILLISSFALFIRFGWRLLNYWLYTFNFISCSFTSLIDTRPSRFIHITKFKVMIYWLSMPSHSSLSFLI